LAQDAWLLGIGLGFIVEELSEWTGLSGSRSRRGGQPVSADQRCLLAALMVLTQTPRAPTPGASFRDATDRLVGADPGSRSCGRRYRWCSASASRLVLVSLLVRLTGALQLPAGSSAEPVLSATNHALLVVSLLCGVWPR